MTTRLITSEQVHALFSFERAISSLSIAFARLQGGRALVPSRGILRVGEANDDPQVLTMPACCGEGEPVVVKLSALAPRNRGRDLPLIHAMVAVLDGATGRLLAIMAGASLTTLRTAAMSGLATRLLARQDARSVAILGAGEQARWQLAAVCAVRAIDKAVVFSRTRARAEALARWAEGRSLCASRVRVAKSVDEALAEADIVCTATSTGSATPLFAEDRVRPGMHFNAIGGVDETACELPPQCLGQGYTVVEQREAAMSEAGEIIEAVRLGATTPQRLVEIGDVVLGHQRARASSEEVTIFKSVGLAIQDAAIATMIHERALEAGVGSDITIE